MLVSITRWALGSKIRKRPNRLQYYTNIVYYAALYYTAIQVISRLSTRVTSRRSVGMSQAKTPVASHSHVNHVANRCADVVSTDRSTPFISPIAPPPIPPNAPAAYDRPTSSRDASTSPLPRRYHDDDASRGLAFTDTVPDHAGGGASPIDFAMINAIAAQLRGWNATSEASLRRASVMAADSATDSAVAVDDTKLVLSHANARYDSMIVAANAAALEYVNHHKLPTQTGLLEDMVISIPLGIVFGPVE